MHRPGLIVLITGAMGLVGAGTARAADPAAAAPDFIRDVRPILSDACFNCHGPDPATRKGGYRLDLRDADARLAGERGVRIVVSTDAHSVGALAYATLGIGQARRAWLTKEQIVNTRPWSKVKK